MKKITAIGTTALIWSFSFVTCMHNTTELQYLQYISNDVKIILMSKLKGRYYIRTFGNLKQVNKFFNTFLQNNKVIQDLLANAFMQGYKYPLHRALYYKKNNIAKRLCQRLPFKISHEYDENWFFKRMLSTYPSKSETPLEYALRLDNKEIMGILFKKALGSEKQPRSSLMYLAVDGGHLKTVKVLLSINAHYASLKTNSTLSPLHVAAKKGHLEVVKLLLNHRVDIEARNKFGQTPLHFATLLPATHQNKIELIHLLLIHKVNVNVKNRFGITPLHIAARHGYLKVAELFLAYDANIEAKDNTGETPLHKAINGGQKEIVSLLLEHNADIQARPKFLNETPLYLATKKGNKELVNLLLQHGAHVDALTKYNLNTPLYFAVRNNFVNIAELLLKKGASVERSGKFDLKPLCIASYKGNFFMVQLLLKHKAGFNFRDKYGNTPLHYAVMGRNPEIVRLLLLVGANPNLQNKLGFTPQEVAVNEMCFDCDKIFNEFMNIC